MSPSLKFTASVVDMRGDSFVPLLHRSGLLTLSPKVMILLPQSRCTPVQARRTSENSCSAMFVNKGFPVEAIGLEAPRRVDDAQLYQRPQAVPHLPPRPA
jgi:hypothetical protein